MLIRCILFEPSAYHALVEEESEIIDMIHA
jgi:hypothetical protein